jgi:hypothetical protein
MPLLPPGDRQKTLKIRKLRRQPAVNIHFIARAAIPGFGRA